ncbi:YheT family hydrolase [Robiginitalea aurantiaca]|uniref:Alpha/beta fold hydrolase n=1 Tax=Robiginitalea aurantiaca TaxID=3056915 RepID=A0ABT7WEB9_9FLAO|nr:alpha/beta fold hydrolase [Robiginitalea aurantiaca]MDM9631266.1 alpha/beta fold hydrolase [Robiginitalea aurantiaca]
MPLISSDFKPSIPFRNGHASTIYSALLRKPVKPGQERERLILPDGDFLDLDWTRKDEPRDRLILLLHGLEGNAQRPYMLGSAGIFSENGYDVCAVNFRGCSGEPNLRFRSYHSGATEDLSAVLQHILKRYDYEKIFLKGFSLGGNLILKFLGERSELTRHITAAAVISVPCDLHDSLIQLNRPANWLYAQRFLKSLREKVAEKQSRFPDALDQGGVDQIKSLKDFDDIYTSRAHGFKDALDYYQKCSSLQFIESIATPTLLLNAKNDSFLGAKCYPEERCRDHAYVHFESPRFGGHVGFVTAGSYYYSEKRSLEFLSFVK